MLDRASLDQLFLYALDLLAADAREFKALEAPLPLVRQKQDQLFKLCNIYEQHFNIPSRYKHRKSDKAIKDAREVALELMMYLKDNTNFSRAKKP